MCANRVYVYKFLSKDFTEKMHASWESTEVDDTVETVRGGLSKSPPSHGYGLNNFSFERVINLFLYVFIGKTIINATLMI